MFSFWNFILGALLAGGGAALIYFYRSAEGRAKWASWVSK